MLSSLNKPRRKMSSKSKYRANKYYLDHPRPVNTNRREQEVKFDDDGRPYTDQTPSEREAEQFLGYQVVDDTYILEGGSSENYSASEDIVQDLVIDQKTLDIINDTLPTPDGKWKFRKNTRIPNDIDGQLLSLADRVQWAAENGYSFTDCDVRNTVDFPIPKNSYIYPVFRMVSAADNIDSAVSRRTAESAWLRDRYVLNCYANRLAAVYTGEQDPVYGFINVDDLRTEWYTPKTNSLVYNPWEELTEPVRNITYAEFSGKKSRNKNLVLKITGELAVVTFGSIAAGAAVAYFAANPKLALYVGGGLFLAGSGAVIMFNSDDIFYSAVEAVVKDEVISTLPIKID